MGKAQDKDRWGLGRAGGKGEKTGGREESVRAWHEEGNAACQMGVGAARAERQALERRLGVGGGVEPVQSEKPEKRQAHVIGNKMKEHMTLKACPPSQPSPKWPAHTHRIYMPG